MCLRSNRVRCLSKPKLSAKCRLLKTSDTLSPVLASEFEDDSLARPLLNKLMFIYLSFSENLIFVTGGDNFEKLSCRVI